jgi:hypothetical protein
VLGAVVTHAAHDALGVARVREPGQDRERHALDASRPASLERGRLHADPRVGIGARRLLGEREVGEVEVRRRGADHAVGAELAGVGIDVVVERAVDGRAGEHEGEHAARPGDRGRALQPVEREREALRAAELEPVEHAEAGLDAFEHGAQARQPGVAELGERRAEVGGRQHDEMGQGCRAPAGT